jgi:hypothetical protein
MKKITILTLAFFFTWHSAYCQKTASDYIAKQLENTRLGDSCFSGFYFIKFSIGKNNKAKDIQFSSAMPIILQSCIKQRIDSSLLFFDHSFLASAIKKNKQLLIPVLCVYNLDCKLKGNKYLDELNLDSTGTEKFKYNLLNVIIYGILDSQLNLETTFGKSLIFEFEKNEHYFDGIVLDPCMIISKQNQGAKY